MSFPSQHYGSSALTGDSMLCLVLSWHYLVQNLLVPILIAATVSELWKEILVCTCVHAHCGRIGVHLEYPFVSVGTGLLALSQ